MDHFLNLSAEINPFCHVNRNETQLNPVGKPKVSGVLGTFSCVFGTAVRHKVETVGAHGLHWSHMFRHLEITR